MYEPQKKMYNIERELEEIKRKLDLFSIVKISGEYYLQIRTPEGLKKVKIE